jgi:hypothetical protein
MKSGAPQGRRLGDKHLEFVEAADVVLHVAGHWAAVENIRNRTESREASVSTQLVLNKYNTNYEALGWLTQLHYLLILANFIKTIYYKWMNYHKPILHKKLINIS